MGASRRMNSSVLRKGVEDMPEEALAEVRTDKKAEEEDQVVRKRKEETGISPGTRKT